VVEFFWSKGMLGPGCREGKGHRTSRGENDKDYEAGGREGMEEMMYRSRQVNTNAFLKGVGSLYPTMDKLQLRNVPEPSAYLSVLKSIQINIAPPLPLRDNMALG